VHNEARKRGYPQTNRERPAQRIRIGSGTTFHHLIAGVGGTLPVEEGGKGCELGEKHPGQLEKCGPSWGDEIVETSRGRLESKGKSFYELARGSSGACSGSGALHPRDKRGFFHEGIPGEQTGSARGGPFPGKLPTAEPEEGGGRERNAWEDRPDQEGLLGTPLGTDRGFISKKTNGERRW